MPGTDAPNTEEHIHRQEHAGLLEHTGLTPAPSWANATEQL